MTLLPSKRSMALLALVAAAAVFAAGACGKADPGAPIVEPPPPPPPPQPPPPPPPPPPAFTIGLDPTTLAFSDTVGTSSPAARTVAVTNTTAGVLAGLSAGTIVYPTGRSGWLRATLSGAETPATLTVTAFNDSMVAGTYTATIPVTSSLASNSPQNVSVTYTLAPRPLPPKPAPIPGTVIMATGNLGSCAGDLQRASANVVAAHSPDLLFVMGDNAATTPGQTAATLQDYQNCYDPAWGRFRSITYAAIGDHDQDSATGFAPGADAYFGPGAVGAPHKNYYSFNVGSWHIVVLNVQSGGPTRPVPFYNGTEQLNWLRQDLRDHYGQYRCTLAIWHDPMWISSSNGPSYPTDRYPNYGYRDQPIRGVWIALYEYDADVVINGGRHIYERFAPMRYDGTYENPSVTEFAADSARGIVQFSAGLGGNGPIATPSVTITHPLSLYRSGGNGVLKLTLGDRKYTWEFINTQWSTIQDWGTGTCH